jgi:hypothetical protein
MPCFQMATLPPPNLLASRLRGNDWEPPPNSVIPACTEIQPLRRAHGSVCWPRVPACAGTTEKKVPGSVAESVCVRDEPFDRLRTGLSDHRPTPFTYRCWFWRARRFFDRIRTNGCSPCVVRSMSKFLEGSNNHRTGSIVYTPRRENKRPRPEASGRGLL